MKNVEQEMYEQHLKWLKEMEGKTIKSAVEDHEGNINIIFTNNSTYQYEIFNHCAGGVMINKTRKEK